MQCRIIESLTTQLFHGKQPTVRLSVSVTLDDEALSMWWLYLKFHYFD